MAVSSIRKTTLRSAACNLGKLPRDILFDRLRLRLFEDALVLNAGTNMLLAHHSNSFLIRRGPRFPDEPVQRDQVLSEKQSGTRAVRFVGKRAAAIVGRRVTIKLV